METPGPSATTADTVTVDAPAGERAAASQLELGTTLGRYLVLELVGTGGMGKVYRAYDPKLRREVALKVLRVEKIKTEVDARARLVQEARAMAQLSHPNVLPVYAVDADGEDVFIAMEFVEGQTLRRWLAERERPWTTVVAKLIDAGRGLAAAHAAELVHRDFKPTNVLVSNEGRVTVMDFGLARVAGHRRLSSESNPLESGPSSGLELASASGPLTREGTVMGTPAYMAPEQHRGEAADARSDQYSFCLTAYRALYGELPFPSSDARTLYRHKLAAKFTPLPKPIPRRVFGVLARGMAPEPEDRWPSMDALLGELGRARSAGRRRLAAAAIGTFLLAIFAASFSGLSPPEEAGCDQGATRFASAWDEGRRGELEASFARTKAPFANASAQRVVASLDLYAKEWVDQYAQACEASADALLDLRMTCLRRRADEVGALVDVFLDADADVARRASAAVSRLPPVGPCGDAEFLSAGIERPSDEAAAREVDALRSRLAEASALERAGRYYAAVPMIEQLLTEATAIGHRPLIAELQRRLGVLQELDGDYEGSRRSLEAAYFGAVASGFHREAAEAASALVFTVGERFEDTDQALEWAKHARAHVEGLKARHVEAALEQNLGIVKTRKLAFDEALEHKKRALELFREVHGEEHPDVANALANIGVTLTNMGKFDEAMGYYEASAELRERTLGPDHPQYAASLHNIGATLDDWGRYREAIAAYDRALDIRRRSLGEDHPETATTLNNLGVSYDQLGESEAALRYHRAALEIRLAKFGPDTVQVGQSLTNLGNVLFGRGDLDGALEHYERAAEIWERANGPDDVTLAMVVANMGVVYNRKGRHAEAAAAAERSLATYIARLGDEHTVVGAARYNLGSAYKSLGRLDEALTQMTLARELIAKGHGETHHQVGKADCLRGEILQEQGEPALARPLLASGMHVLADADGLAQDLAGCKFSLARVLWLTPADRMQARELAQAARSAAQQLDDASLTLPAEIGRWLATHR